MLNHRLASKSRIRLGIVANEFFDQRISRMGGFGMLSKQIAEAALLATDKRLDVDMYWGEAPEHVVGSGKNLSVYGRPLRYPTWNWRRDKLSILTKLATPDIFLTIDYRANYEYFLSMFTKAPMVMWVQDPKTPEDWDRIATCRIPGQGDVMPKGLEYIDCTPLAELVKQRRRKGLKTIFAAPSPFLEAKIESTYGCRADEVVSLCYPMEPAPEGPYIKSEKPTVMFLGRLDAQKRPWIIPEIARRMPDVTFRLFGKSHFTGPGAWEPDNLPPNVEMLGHTEGAEKHEMIASSWLHLNCAIHEGLPIAFVEGLQRDVPIVSCVNPERVAERFGRYVGEFRGDGMQSVDAFVTALRELIDNHDERQRLAEAGRTWANETHSAKGFLTAFNNLLEHADSMDVPA
jgi:glycosyltransferase involved in cell wall biosynthesis